MSLTLPAGHADDPLVKMLAALEAHGCRGRGPNWQCPAHEDRSPSLRIARGRNGALVIHCHAGCDPAQVLAKLGLGWPDLYPAEQRTAAAAPRPDLAELEAMHRRGALALPHVELGPMPDDADMDMRAIAEDVRYLLALNAAAGERRPLPYSCRFAADRKGWPGGYKRASRAIRRLMDAGVIERAGALQPRGGQARGTLLLVAPDRSVTRDVVAVTRDVVAAVTRDVGSPRSPRRSCDNTLSCDTNRQVVAA